MQVHTDCAQTSSPEHTGPRPPGRAECSTHVFPTEQGKSEQFSKARLALGSAEPSLWGFQRHNVCTISRANMSKLKVA